MKIYKTLLALTFIFTAQQGFSQDAKHAPPTATFAKTKVPPELDPPIPKGAMIEVNSYDPVSETYSLILVNERAVGPNVATIQDLAKAVSTLNAKTLQEKPNAILTNQYLLDNELRLLSERGVALRKKQLHKKTK